MHAERSLSVLIPAILVWTGFAGAHDSLYHYVEVRLADAAAPEVTFSIHAAELASARVLGADPAGNDLEWLRGRTEAEIKTLLAEAVTLVTDTFTLAADGGPVELAKTLRFPAPALLAANPAGNEAARPGFLEATLVLPAGTRVLTVGHGPDSGKRLMLVLSRPGAFPLVRDLAPGESAPLNLIPNTP